MMRIITNRRKNFFYEFESCSEEITVHPGSSIKGHLAPVYGFYHVVDSPQDYQRTGFIKLESSLWNFYRRKTVLNVLGRVLWSNYGFYHSSNLLTRDLLNFHVSEYKENLNILDSTAVSIFVVILVELTNIVFVNWTNTSTNIETAVLSTL